MLSFGKTLCLSAIMATLAVTAGAQIASADGQSSETGNYTSVSGTARFERRHTVTPLFCSFDGCIKPKTYWSLVVQAGGARYEFDKEYAEGQETAPESIQVGAVVVRPGTHLVVVAHVEVVSREYAILSDVQSVRVDMDERAEFSSLEGAPFFGWTCRSVGEPRPVYVDVEQISRGGDYSMRVMSETGDGETSLRTIAAFGHVSLLVTEAAINFAGTTQQIHGELDIDQRGGRLNNLDSVLRLSGQVHATDVNAPIETSVKLVCDRTR